MRMTTPVLAMLAIGGLVAVSATGCTEPKPQACQRYDALSLTRENGFSARLDWKSPRMVDSAVERIEVAVAAIRPMTGPIELVHVVGDSEADHWTLHVPDFNNSPTSLCSISAAGEPPNCGAVLQNPPFSPGGYYYLRAGGNTVLEAGLSFYLCD